MLSKILQQIYFSSRKAEGKHKTQVVCREGALQGTLKVRYRPSAVPSNGFIPRCKSAKGIRVPSEGPVEENQSQRGASGAEPVAKSSRGGGNTFFLSLVPGHLFYNEGDGASEETGGPSCLFCSEH